MVSVNEYLTGILYKAGDSAETLVLKKIWILLAGICILYPTTEAFLLALNGIYEHSFWRLCLSLACLILGVVFFTNKSIKLETIWLLLCLTVLTITSIIQYLTGGLLHSAGIAFIALASTIVALVQPNRRYAHFLFFLYLIFMIGGTILQPYMSIDDQSYTASYKARYMAKFLCGSIAIYLTFLYFIIQIEKIREAKENKLKELDRAKTKFYTNMTHEFRTPLTMILGWAERISEIPGDHLRDGIASIQQNGNKLLHMVNQLMDISKLEAGCMVLNLSSDDIIPSIKNTVEIHRGLAHIQGIKIHFINEVGKLTMDHDSEKVESIMSNILANALKFTPDEGDIYIIISKDEENLKIKISDTGPGIPKKDLPYIFDRFYQVDHKTARLSGGSGIGLAVTKGMIEMMSGVIEVSSVAGSGTAFTIVFPIRNKAPIALTASKENPIFIGQGEKLDLPHKDSENPLILVVEDHPEMLHFVASILNEDYRTMTAKNGREGIDMAIESSPDLIITDIMMPEIDGIELSNILKKDIRTSHIPIVMLTAKSDMDSKIEGLETGAEVYLTKPFSKKELIVRIKKILQTRQKLQQHYWSIFKKDLNHDNNHLPFASMENDFIKKINSIIRDHLEDPQFSVEILAREAAMSYSQLYRKLKSLTGHTAIQYIHEIRLSKAKELLISSHLPISEIAYRVGIEDPVYFTRVFKKRFGKTPSHYRSLVQL